jgi:hypothetical protein
MINRKKKYPCRIQYLHSIVSHYDIKMSTNTNLKTITEYKVTKVSTVIKLEGASNFYSWKTITLSMDSLMYIKDLLTGNPNDEPDLSENESEI